MNTLLWLDDFRSPFREYTDWLKQAPRGDYDQLVWVKTYEDFINWINENGLPAGISFDHDLGGDHYGHEHKYWKDHYSGNYTPLDTKTGYDCAKWLVEYCMNRKIEIPPYSIHSLNPVGRENIHRRLQDYIYRR